MTNPQQEIYINLDDSGKLTSKENICVYGGIVFLSKMEKDKFITQYRGIINQIKCDYCRNEKTSCKEKCPEIKNTNIKPKDKRWIMNYLKKYYIVALIIKNDAVYDYIKKEQAAKGRFLDYSIRRMIKEIIKIQIQNQKIKPNQPLRIIINIDEQPTKNNGYYNLKDGLIEELKYGIINFDYLSSIPPIIKKELEVKVTYQNSEKSYAIQAADLLAGTIRKKTLEAYNEQVDIKELFTPDIDFKIILP